ncbi:hypothetical protein WICPIJ_008766 [Wickerhamomyces pijperi]|uniref:Transmembrane protein n=1 Tax=Wickerhamomyces pijperi TaxID=599730 RepID=A0A9P8PV61_WICPI|nr:hypothetical protein WICPIJ_008766 [Wickerhamomyces pijperi]
MSAALNSAALGVNPVLPLPFTSFNLIPCFLTLAVGAFIVVFKGFGVEVVLEGEEGGMIADEDEEGGCFDCFGLVILNLIFFSGATPPPVDEEEETGGEDGGADDDSGFGFLIFSFSIMWISQYIGLID